jgi:hypothetical protein
VYLGAASPNPENRAANALAYALIAAGALAASVAGNGLALAVSPTDPRGLATFGLAGVWMLVLGLGARGSATLPSSLAMLAIAGGVDLILLFFATVAQATPLILVTGGLASVILGPAFWIWSGRILSRPGRLP